jgi:uncharacterized protein involved in exopolysaccharide biosynthesis
MAEVDEAVAAADHAAYVAERAEANLEAHNAKIQRLRDAITELEAGRGEHEKQAKDAQKAHDEARKKAPNRLVGEPAGGPVTEAIAGSAVARGG